MCVHIDNVSVCQTILLLLFIAAEDWTMRICVCSGTLLDRRLSKFLHSRTGSWMRSTTNEIRKVWLTSFWIGPKRKVGKLPSLFSKERNYVQLHVWCALKFSRWIYISKYTHSRDNSGYGLSQWGTTLHSNVVSHWLSPYPEWSLLRSKYVLCFVVIL